VFEVTLLGAASKNYSGEVERQQTGGEHYRRQAKKAGPPELIYAITSHQPRSKIKNVIQASAAILSQSRTIFFGKVLCLLRHYDPRLVELLYTGNGCSLYLKKDTHTHTICLFTAALDTDSVILGVNSQDFSQLVKPEFADRRQELEEFLFEDPLSPVEQSGYFKVRW
jgi:hypothetical protein